ncbi:hypothetical protein ACVDG3_06965 [Meridianimarinicoccus sp. RP-17]|uniref:hypothetical protein n=1 Tax=Meridianimarinicoccus zhengii TaxID=2056810 RepID=UPI0013A6C274|nr:hypothetical protein [Phycocomes zhengii]
MIAPDFLSRLPEIVAEHVHGLLPELVTCEAIEGDFDAAELKRISLRAPAVLVAALGLNQELEISWPQGEVGVSMAAFVVTRDHRDLRARASAWAITQALATMVPEATWGLPECGPAARMRQRVLITRETRAAAVHLSAVTWTQPAVLNPFANADPIDPAVYVSRAPEIGEANRDAYTRVGGAA